jgi:hypothetical protein
MHCYGELDEGAKKNELRIFRPSPKTKQPVIPHPIPHPPPQDSNLLKLRNFPKISLSLAMRDNRSNDGE